MEIEVLDDVLAEPVSLGEARAYFRVTSASEDDVISQLITAARQTVEDRTGRALAPQALRLVLDGFPPGDTLPLPRSPLVDVESVVYLDASGAPQTLDPSRYQVRTATTPGAIYAPAGWPQAHGPGSVQVTYTCGYEEGVTEPPPEAVLLAVKQLALHWFDHRGTTIAGTIATPIPQTLDFLLDRYRVRYRLPS